MSFQNLRKWQYPFFSVVLVFLVCFLYYYVIAQLPNRETVEAFAPHQMCLLGNEQMIKTIRAGDLETFVSYMIIGAAFLAVSFVTRWLWGMYRFMIFLTAIFVLCCGVGHFIDYMSMYENWYWAKAISCQITGKMSILTACVGIGIVPFLYRDLKNLY